MLDYPIVEVIPELQKTISDHTTVILQAPPGAGKSTVLPLYLLDAGWLEGKKIVMLEPRRLAAKSVAERLSQELGETAGKTAGYRVRFESKVSEQTRIEVVTEGILTRMIQSDSSLESVGLLIFDEFHERSLQSDLALVLARQVQKFLRDDLRILVMSATLDTEKIGAALGNAPVITSQGKQYPVDIRYAAFDTDSNVVNKVVPAIRKALQETTGDVLVFLPGSGEIRRTEEMLASAAISARVVPLYGDLPFRQQQEAILPAKDGSRKIVLATSIAETSLTIEGITTVVDAGLSRVPRFDPNSGLTRLETVRVTRDAADQRAGRAGRLGPGVCYRLWTEAVQRHLVERRKPEILEADLASLVLEVSAWGTPDIVKMDWLTPPPAGAVSQSKELLWLLGALDTSGITAKGREMLRLPTHPRISHMLLEAFTAEEKALVCDVAAVIEERDPLGREHGADLRLRVEAMRRWRSGERVAADRSVLERIEKMSAQWRRLLRMDADNAMPDHYAIGRWLLAAYPERVALQKTSQGELYTLANGRVARLPDHDPLSHEPWLCVAQVDLGEKQGRIFAAAPVDPDDLEAIAVKAETVDWDDATGKVIASSRQMVGNLTLKTVPSSVVDENSKNDVIFRQIREKGLKWIDWDEDTQMLQARIQSLHLWRAEEPWPDVREQKLLETLEQWMTPFLSGVTKLTELRKLDKQAILMSLVPWSLHSKFSTLAPARIEVPSGSLIKVNYYEDGRTPYMEVRLQELFGLAQTPTVNEGKISLVMHLLSPGYKPVQVTSDLSSFWHTTYHEVRKELRMRYPKHSWPEDPWTATAVRKGRSSKW